jgi:hypothetical protein
VTKVKREEFKIFIESNENENTTCQNLWRHSKCLSKRKVYSYKCLCLKIRALSNEKNLMIHIKLLEKQEQTKPKTSRWREIKKIRTKLN